MNNLDSVSTKDLARELIKRKNVWPILVKEHEEYNIEINNKEWGFINSIDGDGRTLILRIESV